LRKKPIVYTYTLKKALPNQAALHARWGWYKHSQYFRREFINLLEEQNKYKIKAFELEVRYRTGHDVDNIAPFTKMFVDAYRELEFVPNDTKDIYKSLKIVPDIELPKKTLQFKIIPC
jgi:hypothetical protein